MIEEIKIRDQRKPRHFWGDNEIVDLYLPKIGHYAFSVYMVFCRMADNATAQCAPSIPTIAKLLGISDPTVKTALKTLEEHKLITVTPRYKEQNGRRVNTSNLYTLLEIDKSRGGQPNYPGNQITQEGRQLDCPGVGNEVAPFKDSKKQDSLKEKNKSVATTRNGQKPHKNVTSLSPEQSVLFKRLMDWEKTRLGVSAGAKSGVALSKLLRAGCTEELAIDIFELQLAEEKLASVSWATVLMQFPTYRLRLNGDVKQLTKKASQYESSSDRNVRNIEEIYTTYFTGEDASLSDSEVESGLRLEPAKPTRN